jgi:hypothetical protein
VSIASTWWKDKKVWGLVKRAERWVAVHLFSLESSARFSELYADSTAARPWSNGGGALR